MLARRGSVARALVAGQGRGCLSAPVRRRRFASAAAAAASSSPLKVAVCAGDGIGVDVSDATFRMLAAVQSSYGFVVEPTFYDWGCDYCDTHGVCAPDDMIDVSGRA